MPWPRASLTLLVASLFTPITARAAYPPPSASVLSEIRREHGAKDWWIVTTDSARYVVQVRHIGDDALSRLKPGHGTRFTPDPLPWSSIARVDKRTSKFLSRRITGAVLGGFAGLLLPFAFGAEGDQGETVGLLAGAALGGWLGGLYGDRQATEHTLYVSPSLTSPHATPAVARDSIVAASAVAPDSIVAAPDTTRVATATAATLTLAIAAACDEIDEKDVLRIQADFGTFEGFASGADSTGVLGLRSRIAPGAQAFSGPLEWKRINSVEVQENHAKKGAIKGAVTLGAIGLIGGMLAILGANAYGNDSANPSASWVVTPAVVGAAIGGGIGGAVGASKLTWRRIYP
jgi:hypothetical protein